VGLPAPWCGACVDGGAIMGRFSSGGSDPHSLLEQVRQKPVDGGLNLALQGEAPKGAPTSETSFGQAGLINASRARPQLILPGRGDDFESSGASLSALAAMLSGEASALTGGIEQVLALALKGVLFLSNGSW